MKAKAFDVYLKRKHIDTVFCDEDMTAEEVKKSLINHDGYNKSLINHDGYNPNIKVIKIK